MNPDVITLSFRRAQMRKARQVSIRFTLGLFVVFAVIFALFQNRRQELLATMAKVEGLGGHVVLDTAFDESGSRRAPTEGMFFDIRSPTRFFWFACRQTKQIVFRGSTVTDSDLEFTQHVKGLTAIDLFETSITSDCLMVLAKCKTLRSITLSPEQIAPESIDNFHSSNPNCKIVVEGMDFWLIKKQMEDLVDALQDSEGSH